MWTAVLPNVSTDPVEFKGGPLLFNNADIVHRTDSLINLIKLYSEPGCTTKGMAIDYRNGPSLY